MNYRSLDPDSGPSTRGASTRGAGPGEEASDSGTPHDYRSFDDVDRIFDAACAFEWIEHLDLEDAERSIHRLHGCLRPGAVVVITTPNTFYPPAWLRDSTHRTPFCYDELAGLLDLCGFELVSCHRLYHAPFVQKWLRRAFAWVHRAIGIDYARQIAVVARRR